MRLIIDTHLHIYPCYDIKKFFDYLRNNLLALDPGARYAGILAERHDCHYFKRLCDNHVTLLGDNIRIEPAENVLFLRETGFPDLLLFAGRQIITHERLEILALTTDVSIEDGLPAEQVIRLVLQAGGLPVIGWAPGKWFAARGRMVARLLELFAPGSLFVGDTTLRPTLWPCPLLMRKAVSRGFMVLAGSDPLPFAGEERLAGRYGIRLDGDAMLSDPLGDVRRLLRDVESTGHSLVGKRDGVLAVIRRLVKNERLRQTG